MLPLCHSPAALCLRPWRVIGGPPPHLIALIAAAPARVVVAVISHRRRSAKCSARSLPQRTPTPCSSRMTRTDPRLASSRLRCAETNNASAPSPSDRYLSTTARPKLSDLHRPGCSRGGSTRICVKVSSEDERASCGPQRIHLATARRGPSPPRRTFSSRSGRRQSARS